MLRAAPLLTLLALPVLSVGAGCNGPSFDASRAAPTYPVALHRPQSVDIQVLRDDTTIELVNATARSYRDFDLWINQRYVKHVDALPAGARVRLSLWGFYDQRGERLNAGGFWRTEAATKVWLVELQESPDAPLIGLVTISRDEE